MIEHSIDSNKECFSFGDDSKIEYITILENKFLPKEALELPRLKRWMTPFEKDVKVKVNGEFVNTILETIIMLYLGSNYKLSSRNSFKKHKMKISNDFLLYKFEDYDKMKYILKLEKECLPEEVVVKSRIAKWSLPFKKGTEVTINGYKVNTVLDAIIMLYIGTSYSVNLHRDFLEYRGLIDHIILIGDEVKKFNEDEKPHYITILETQCLRKDSNLPKLIRPFSKKVKINKHDVENILEAILMLYLSTNYIEGKEPSSE
ncbi:MAG: hypothetical protein ACP5G1_03760 [Nanopusillaceae archaeon]